MASVVVTDADKRKIMLTLPEWLRPEPGFRFVDEGGDTYIVLGFGGWREWAYKGAVSLVSSNKDGSRVSHTICDLVFHPATLVGAMLYKGEFSIIDIVAMEGLDQCKPLQLGGD